MLGMGLCITMPVSAGEPILFDSGMKLDWRVNSTYTLSTRLESPDKVLAANAGGNDGDNNFDKGALTANRLGLLLDATLSKGDTGFVLSASTFYDDVYHHSNDNEGPVNKAGDVNEFTSKARRFHGGYSRILDAYLYTSFDFAESSRATVRAGNHVVSWGEALFFPGISLAQGPADGTKTGIPGTETKDQLLPESQVSMMVEMTPKWSLMAHAQYDWHETLAPAPGSFLNTSDAVGEGGSCLGPYVTIPTIGFSDCSFGKRGKDIKPDDIGQWGLGTRYRVTDETELGIYYLNYHDRTPLPEINAFTPGVSLGGGRQIGNGSYRVRYFDDVKLIGATFSTSFGVAAVAGEISYKEGAPALVNTVVNPATGATIPNPTRADVMQVNLNAFANLGRTPIADQTQLLGEIAYVDISNVKARKAPGVEALGPAAAFFPASKDLSFGKSGLAISSTLSLTYPGVFTGWDLAVPISYSQQLRGRTILGGVGGEGDIRYSIGANFTYNRNFQIGMTYLGYAGDAEVANLKKQRLQTDRDQLSLVMKYSF
ncbi:DUF1302 domain-containing protein [Aromatoleum anaerobium]|uniref:DUF1302 domain-containing protein n=1 Tax=Aromatoleum anaerobium TaxID=182180 RepID=UPI0031BA0ACE